MHIFVCVFVTAIVRKVKKELLLNKQFGNYVACLITFAVYWVLGRHLFSFDMNKKERNYLDDVIGR